VVVVTLSSGEVLSGELLSGEVLSGELLSGELLSGVLSTVTEVGDCPEPEPEPDPEPEPEPDDGTLTLGGTPLPVGLVVVVTPEGPALGPWLADPDVVLVIVTDVAATDVVDDSVVSTVEPTVDSDSVVSGLGANSRLPGFDQTDRVVSEPGLANNASRTAKTEPPAAMAVTAHNSATGTERPTPRRRAGRRGCPRTSRTEADEAPLVLAITDSIASGWSPCPCQCSVMNSVCRCTRPSTIARWS
jgi:hypothetical protein